MTEEQKETLRKVPEFDKFKELLSEDIERAKIDLLHVDPDQLRALQVRIETLATVYNIV